MPCILEMNVRIMIEAGKFLTGMLYPSHSAAIGTFQSDIAVCKHTPDHCPLGLGVFRPHLSSKAGGVLSAGCIYKVRYTLSSNAAYRIDKGCNRVWKECGTWRRQDDALQIAFQIREPDLPTPQIRLANPDLMHWRLSWSYVHSYPISDQASDR